MKFERNEELTKHDRERLIESLTEIAQLYFDGKYRFLQMSTSTEEKVVVITNGICCALSSLRQDFPAYYLIEELEVEMDNRYDNYCSITSPEGWEPRAYMCLFLVEYLKDTI